MHVVTGGAYNGKKKWVKTYYNLWKHSDVYWFSCYQSHMKDLMHDITEEKKFVVIEGMEHGLESVLKRNHNMTAFSFYQQYILPLVEWEKKQPKERKLVIIGTDISKGIVPIDEEIRRVRDETGRLYQILTDYAEDVHIIWFGIATLIRKG